MASKAGMCVTKSQIRSLEYGLRVWSPLLFRVPPPRVSYIFLNFMFSDVFRSECGRACNTGATGLHHEGCPLAKYSRYERHLGDPERPLFLVGSRS